MKSDIEFPTVKGVQLAVVKRPGTDGGQPDWAVYLFNKNSFPLSNVLVVSKGYGEYAGEKQQTGILRFHFKSIPAHAQVVIELIDPKVFHLTNEYWVSYYQADETKIHDKKFLFVPDSIVESNLSHIPELEMEGVVHV